MANALGEGLSDLDRTALHVPAVPIDRLDDLVASSSADAVCRGAETRVLARVILRLRASCLLVALRVVRHQILKARLLGVLLLALCASLPVELAALERVALLRVAARVHAFLVEAEVSGGEGGCDALGRTTAFGTVPVAVVERQLGDEPADVSVALLCQAVELVAVHVSQLHDPVEEDLDTCISHVDLAARRLVARLGKGLVDAHIRPRDCKCSTKVECHALRRPMGHDYLAYCREANLLHALLAVR